MKRHGLPPILKTSFRALGAKPPYIDFLPFNPIARSDLLKAGQIHTAKAFHLPAATAGEVRMAMRSVVVVTTHCKSPQAISRLHSMDNAGLGESVKASVDTDAIQPWFGHFPENLLGCQWLTSAEQHHQHRYAPCGPPESRLVQQCFRSVFHFKSFLLWNTYFITKRN